MSIIEIYNKIQVIIKGLLKYVVLQYIANINFCFCKEIWQRYINGNVFVLHLKNQDPK